MQPAGPHTTRRAHDQSRLRQGAQQAHPLEQADPELSLSRALIGQSGFGCQPPPSTTTAATWPSAAMSAISAWRCSSGRQQVFRDRPPDARAIGIIPLAANLNPPRRRLNASDTAPLRINAKAIGKCVSKC